MIKEALQYLHGLGRDETLAEVVNGENYWKSSGRRVAVPPYPTVMVGSLEGVATYIDSLQEIVRGALLVNIKSATVVEVVGLAIGDTDRLLYVRAEAQGVQEFQCERYLDHEDFVILAACHFHRFGEDFDRVMAYLQGVQAGDSIKLSDDGVSQSATVRRSVESLGTERFTNPVTLYEHSSFTDLHPVPRTFIMRMKGSAKELKVALFEVHNRLADEAATSAIREWFKLRLPDIKILY